MRLRVALVAVILVGSGAVAAPATALRALPTYTAEILNSPEPEAGSQFADFMDSVGDLNGDGVNDVAVSSERQSSGATSGVGRVYVFSGRTREVIRTIQNPDPQPGNGFGDSISGIGDVSGDGVPDLAIAASALDVYTGTGTACGQPEPNGCNEAQGRVYVFSGRTGSLIRRINSPTPQPGEYFGYGFSVATNDLNGDGVRDFVESDSETVGMCDDDADPTTPDVPCPFVGAAYAFSGKDGSLLYRFAYPGPPEPYASFGNGTSNPGDVTGDGVDDIVMGAPNATPRGRAFLFNGRTGAVVRELLDPDDPNNEGAGWPYGIGRGLEPGDVNGDGVRDLIVSAPGQDVGGVNNAGRLYLLSGTNGSLIRTLDDPSPKPTGSLGFSHAGAGDVNGDGTPDIIASRFIFPVNVYLSDSPPVPPPGGAAYVFDGRTGAVLANLPGMVRDGPGSSIASPGDINGDGYPDYFLGGRLLDSGAGAYSGQVIVELSKAPAAPPAPVTAPVTPPATQQPTPGLLPDVTRPTLSAPLLSPGAFRAASSGASTATRVGSRVTYRLSEKASVRFGVERARPGRRVRGTCVTPSRARRRAKACLRYVALRGTFTLKGRKGANAFTFRGRLGGRALAPGRYALRARATDHVGNRSALRRSRFTIVRR